MKIYKIFIGLLLCGFLIAGCTSTTNSTPATATVTSTPAATYTIGGTTAGTLRVSVLDVGQGDSILIQSPAGKTMLVDAGDTDAGSRVVADLKARGVTSLDAAVASHAHADHIGGYQTVLSLFSIGMFYDSGYPSTSSIYEKLLTTIRPEEDQVHHPDRRPDHRPRSRDQDRCTLSGRQEQRRDPR